VKVVEFSSSEAAFDEQETESCFESIAILPASFRYRLKINPVDIVMLRNFLILLERNRRRGFPSIWALSEPFGPAPTLGVQAGEDSFFGGHVLQ